MVRQRGVARRSFSHRRVRRVQKYDHHVIPRRFKIYLSYMSVGLAANMPPPVECEEPTIDELNSKGVPSEEHPYYLGFMKRMLELYRKFTGQTLQMEKDSLIAEYVYRGKDKDVLQQVQIVTEICAGVRVPELEEGDYSSYAIYDSFDDTDCSNAYMAQRAVFNGAENKIIILDAWNERTKPYDIPTKVLGAVLATDLSFYDQDGAWSQQPTKSIYGTYVVTLNYTSYREDCNRIRIYKNGVEIQNLTDAQLGFNANTIKNVDISPTGKFIIVSGERTATGNRGWVVLEGS